MLYLATLRAGLVFCLSTAYQSAEMVPSTTPNRLWWCVQPQKISDGSARLPSRRGHRMFTLGDDRKRLLAGAHCAHSDDQPQLP
jgi:hypothetical protein